MKNWKLLIFQKNLEQLWSWFSLAKEKRDGEHLRQSKLQFKILNEWNLGLLIPQGFFFLEMISRTRQIRKTLPLLRKRKFLENFFLTSWTIKFIE